MTNTFWIKLYIEVLDDPKMGNLSDRLYRRAIEMFLMAGEMEKGGNLPTEKDIAWRLRIPFDILHEDISLLIQYEILEVLEDGLHMKNFEKWQAGIHINDRMKHYREREKKRQYYGDVTNRNIYKSRVDENREKEIKNIAKQNAQPVDQSEMEALKERLKKENPEGYAGGTKPLIRIG